MKKMFSENDHITDNDGRPLFRLLEPAGYNGRYFVVHAWNTVSDRSSLLKFVNVSDDTYKINNLTREGNFRFFYPYIEHVYGNFKGVDPDGDQIYGAEVEFIEGKNLSEYRIDLEEQIQDGRISREEGEREIFVQMLQFLCGMNYYTSFAKQIYLQRDLKPDNIRITPDGKVKIVDFDVAHLSGSTKTMHVAGWEAGFSRGYTSPEVYHLVNRKKGQDLHCEIYSAGRVLFYWLNGVEYYTQEQCMPVEEGGSPDALFSAPYCRNQELAYGTRANRDRFLKRYFRLEYEPLIRILDKMCASPREERYESIGEIIYDMKQFLLGLCGNSPEKTANFLRLSKPDVLLDTGAWNQRSFIPMAYRINGIKKGKPLYEKAMQDICVDGRCLVTVYNLDGKVYYIPGAGVLAEGLSQDYTLRGTDRLICDGTEIEFTIGEEISCQER